MERGFGKAMTKAGSNENLSVLALSLLLSLALFACNAGPNRTIAQAKAVDAANYGAEAFANGDLQRAMLKYSEALRLDRSGDSRPAELLDLLNLARVFIAMEDLEKASAFLKDAEALSIHLKDEARLSEVKATASKVMFMRGDYDAAYKAIEESLAIDKGLGLKSGAKLNLKGVMLSRQARKQEAVAVLTEALNINRKDANNAETANSLRALGRLRLGSAGAGALEDFSAAYGLDKALGDPKKIAVDLGGMAEANLLNKAADDAAFLFERAYIVSVSAGLNKEAVSFLDRLVDMHRSAGAKDKAERFLRLKEAITGPAPIDKTGSPKVEGE